MTSSIGPADLETVNCVLCDETAATTVVDRCPDRLLGTPGRYSIVRCRGCGLLRTNPRPTSAAIDRHYPAEYLPFNLDDARPVGLAGTVQHALEAGFERRHGRTDLVAPPDRPGRRLLDIGAGSGAYAARMAEAGWDVWALEPSEVAVRWAAQRLGADRVSRGRIDDADYPEGFFDLVTMTHVVEHLHDPVAGLARVRGWMGTGGRIRVTVPDVDSIDRKLLRSSWLGFDLPRHLFHFSPETLGKVLERAGYSVESTAPQWLPSMFAQSVGLAVNRVRGRTGYGMVAYYAAYPFAALLATAGFSGGMTAIAVKVA